MRSASFIASLIGCHIGSAAVERQKRGYNPLGIVEPGTAADCVWWYENEDADLSLPCDVLPRMYGASDEDFYAWNPSLAPNCENYKEGYSYCVEVAPEPVPSGLPSTLAPDITQVDLVFPRNGTTYKPVYPFPIVLAVTNAHLVWPYHFSITWGIINAQTQQQVEMDGGLAWTGSGYGSVEDQVSQDKPLLLTWGSANFVNTTLTQFYLYITTYIFRVCQPNGTITNKDFSVTYRHRVFFSLSDDGDLPDIEAAGSEPDPFAAFKIQGTGKLEIYNNEPCLIVDKGPGKRGPVNPSAFTIDSGVADEVEARMLQSARCNGTGQSWPNATGMLNSCPRQRENSGRSMYVPAGIMLSWGMATALAIALGCVWL